jgi:hypothetical protein
MQKTKRLLPNHEDVFQPTCACVAYGLVVVFFIMARLYCNDGFIAQESVSCAHYLSLRCNACDPG